METLPNGLTLEIPEGCFPLSTDSMVLADFIPAGKYRRILDLGSGCGTLGLLLSSQDVNCQVTGIERSLDAHLAAQENIRRNNLEDRMSSICSDLRDFSSILPPQRLDCCISNPPYFSGGAISQKLPAARQAITCTVEDLFAAAAYALRWGGDFYLVHKPEQLSRLCHLAANAGLETKRLRLVRHRADKEPALITIQFRKGGKPGLQLEEITLHHADGSPTEDYRRIYHL